MGKDRREEKRTRLRGFVNINLPVFTFSIRSTYLDEAN